MFVKQGSVLTISRDIAITHCIQPMELFYMTISKGFLL